MNFLYNLAVYDRSIEEVQQALIKVMAQWNFEPALAEIVERTKYSHSNLVPDIDLHLSLRRFLIAPTINKWNIIYQPFGWFSEAQTLSTILSKELEGIALLFLMDDSKGWGYEISRDGKVLDQFHTEPGSATLFEKEGELGLEKPLVKVEIESNPFDMDLLELARLMLPTQEEMKRRTEEEAQLIQERYHQPDQQREEAPGYNKMLAELPTDEEKERMLAALPDPQILEKLALVDTPLPEQQAKYQGQPKVVADLFGLQEDIISERLSFSRSVFSLTAHEEMGRFLSDDLGMARWYELYQELMDELNELSDWRLMIFSRPMTDAEQEWHNKKGHQNFVPPLWLND